MKTVDLAQLAIVTGGVVVPYNPLADAARIGTAAFNSMWMPYNAALTEGKMLGTVPKSVQGVHVPIR